jgi:hypothetical protein
MLCTTTSSPTPHPDTSITVRTVEKPSVKISWIASRSESASSSVTRPRSSARRRTSRASIPPPSSTRVITTWFDSWAAESTIVPDAGFPRAARTAGASMPWSTALRMRWTSGSPISSMTALSTRVSSPCRTSSTCLPCWRARSRTRREALEDVADGSIRTSMIVSCSCVETLATWCTAARAAAPHRARGRRSAGPAR